MQIIISIQVLTIYAFSLLAACDLVDSATYKLAYAGAEQPCQGKLSIISMNFV